MSNALVKKEAHKIAKGGRSAKRKSLVAGNLHEAKAHKVKTSAHVANHLTIKHGAKLERHGKKRSSRKRS